jgi:hypothetical protein
LLTFMKGNFDINRLISWINEVCFINNLTI